MWRSVESLEVIFLRVASQEGTDGTDFTLDEGECGEVERSVLTTTGTWGNVRTDGVSVHSNHSVHETDNEEQH